MKATEPVLVTPAQSGAALPKRKWKFLSGAFAGSLIVHAIILINVGAVVLISGTLAPKGFISDGQAPLMAEDKVEEPQTLPLRPRRMLRPTMSSLPRLPAGLPRPRPSIPDRALWNC